MPKTATIAKRPVPQVDPIAMRTFNSMDSVSRIATGIATHNAKLARIMSQRDIKVRTTQEYLIGRPGATSGLTHTIAFTDGSDIYYNRVLVEALIKVAIDSGRDDNLQFVVAAVSSCFKHELCHLLYTPGNDSVFRTHINRLMSNSARRRATDIGNQTTPCHPSAQSVATAYNILEDCRIETLFVARHRIARGYMTLMNILFVTGGMNHILNNNGSLSARAQSPKLVDIILNLLDDKTIDGLHPWFAGRRYLPWSIRATSKQWFAEEHGDDLADEVEALTIEFNSLPLNGDEASVMSRSMEIITRYAQILEIGKPVEQGDDDDADGDPGDDGTVGDPSNDGKPSSRTTHTPNESRPDQEGLADGGMDDDGKEDREKADIEAAASIDFDDDYLEDEPDEGDADTEGDSEGDDSDVDTDGDSDESGDSDEDGDPSPGGAGHGGGGDEEDGDEPSNLVRSIIDNLMDDDDFTNDVDSATDEFRETDTSTVVQSRFPRQDTQDLSGQFTDAKSLRRRLVSVVKRARNEEDSNWQRELRSGRLDVDRHIRDMAAGKASMDVFRKYDLGGVDATMIDSVVLVDVSSSMGGAQAPYLAEPASAMAWAIKRMHDDLGMGCLVLAYGSYTKLVWDTYEKATESIKYIVPYGSTEPIDGLVTANHFFQRKSIAPNKLLITITDGDWDNSADFYQPVLQSIRDSGADTMLFRLKGDPSRHRYVSSHGYRDYGYEIDHQLDGPLEVLPIFESYVSSINASIARK